MARLLALPVATVTWRYKTVPAHAVTRLLALPVDAEEVSLQLAILVVGEHGLVQAARRRLRRHVLADEISVREEGGLERVVPRHDRGERGLDPRAHLRRGSGGGGGVRGVACGPSPPFRFVLRLRYVYVTVTLRLRGAPCYGYVTATWRTMSDSARESSMLDCCCLAAAAWLSIRARCDSESCERT